MSQRERRHERQAQPSAVGSSGQSEFRSAVDRLLTQGASAIDRALSEDSAAYLAANRQEGGQ